MIPTDSDLLVVDDALAVDLRWCPCRTVLSVTDPERSLVWLLCQHHTTAQRR